VETYLLFGLILIVTKWHSRESLCWRLHKPVKGARPISELTEEELEERINDLEKKIEKAKEHASNVN
jgi:hypothetical protein